MGPKAVPPLTDVLKDGSADDRYLAVYVLGEIGDRRGLAPVSRMLQEEDVLVKVSAIRALAKMGGAEASKAIQAVVLNSAEKGTAYVSVPQPIRPLVEMPLRAIAAKALGGFSDPEAVRALISVLDDPESKVGVAACNSLGLIGREEAIDALIAALEHSGMEVQWAAACGLGRARSERAVGPLIRALGRGNVMAIPALSEIGDRKAVSAIVPFLDDESPGVREAAAEALGKLKGPESREALEAALKRESIPGIRSVLSTALSEFSVTPPHTP